MVRVSLSTASKFALRMTSGSTRGRMAMPGRRRTACAKSVPEPNSMDMSPEISEKDSSKWLESPHEW
jgi:hypothetical protein